MSGGGPPTADLAAQVSWISSGPDGSNRVEVAFLPDGKIAMRSSCSPAGPARLFTRSEWEAFVGGARDGESGAPA
ncbi:MAG: DUF397 domain-containing protein [Streptosporangiaceae bacterium]|jgi:hypothetical protein